MIRTSVPLCLVLLVSTMAYAAVADSDPLDTGISQRRQLQAAAAYPDVLSLMRSRPDLTAATALVQHFPYIVLGLLNPGFEGTIFLPTDAALGKYLNFTSTPALIRSFFNNMDPRLNVLGGIRESLFKRTYWATMTNHIVLNKLYTAADLSKGLYMPSALPDITLTSQVVNGKVVVFGPQSNATVQVADIKAGKAIVHIIDYVLVYRPEGMDDFPLLSTEGADNVLFISIMKKSTLWTALNSAPPPNGPYTVFTPNDAAVTKYLAAKKTTLAKLLANPKACDAIARAHVIQGTAFWLWDIMAVAVLGPTPPESPTFLNGSPVVALLSPTATRVFIKSGKVTAEVTAPVDLGGNTFGCTRLVDGDCAGDYTSVFHILDAVLPSA